MSATPRLTFPFISPGQAQKELFHNEALQLLDVLVAAAVEGLPAAAPPATPAIGLCYIVGNIPSGAWSGHAQSLAAYTTGGWRFLAPVDGMSALVRPGGSTAVFRSGAWEIGTLRGSRVTIDGQQVVGPQNAAIAAPTGGATADLEARMAIGQILAAMRNHGLITS